MAVSSGAIIRAALCARTTLSISFTPDVPAAGAPQTNTWNMDLIDQASGLSAGSFELVFDDVPPRAGALGAVNVLAAGAPPLTTVYDAATGEITMDLGTQSIAVQIGSTLPGGPQHLSQLSSTFSPVGVTKNGSPAGAFTGVTIDDNGLISASYSTGFTRVIYQVPVADVPNPNGLRVLDNQAFALSEGSGSMFLWDAGSGPTGGRFYSRGDAGQRRSTLPTLPGWRCFDPRIH